jgi:uncharacterized sporulation protein YeaH/YhbH (DUF444 family)
MLRRIKFRNCLYRLILIQNIIENKVYKEKMGMLFAFEQMIINTEEVQQDQFMEEQTDKGIDNLPDNSQEINHKAIPNEEGDDKERTEKRISAEIHKLANNERLKDQIMKMTDVSSSMSELILDALLVAQEKDHATATREDERAQYQLNPADVIKEEELEESMGD